MSTADRARFGVDAPPVLATLLLFAIGMLAAAVAALIVGWRLLGLVLLVVGMLASASAAGYVYTTLRGKFAVWAEELDRLPLTGAEHALDLGCGRGMVLVAVARLLPHGKVTGVDLWRSQDQSGNTREAAERNLRVEGVADRVELLTADLRELPLDDGRFDLVLSSLAVHNIAGSPGREQAVSEAFRVLAPGGRLLIADIWRTGDYAAALRRLGATEVTERGLGRRFWYGGPVISPTRMVTARKPG